MITDLSAVIRGNDLGKKAKSEFWTKTAWMSLIRWPLRVSAKKQLCRASMATKPMLHLVSLIFHMNARRDKNNNSYTPSITLDIEWLTTTVGDNYGIQ